MRSQPLQNSGTATLSSGQLNRPRHQDRTARLCLATFRPRQRLQLSAVPSVNRRLMLRSTVTRRNRDYRPPVQLAIANRNGLSLGPTGLLRPTQTQRSRRQVAVHPDRRPMSRLHMSRLPRARHGDCSRARLKNSHLRPVHLLLVQLLPMPKRSGPRLRA